MLKALSNYFMFTTAMPTRNSRLIRYYCDVASISSQTDASGLFFGLKPFEIYDHLVRLCLQQCGKTNARQVFDEKPQRVGRGLCAGKIIHAYSLRVFGCDLNGQLGNIILDLYAKCGDRKYAERVFDSLEKRDVQVWNSVMSLHLTTGSLTDATNLFRLMRIFGVLPNQFTFSIVLSSCARLTAFSFGKQVHCDVIKTGCLCSSFCEGSLIDMYVKCGAFGDARKLFDQMQNPSLVSLTTMMVAFAQSGLPDEALKVFNHMQRLGFRPDHVAFITLMSALVNDGRLDEAKHLFIQMPIPNAVAWNLMISAHVKRGYAVDAISFFLSMRKAGVSSTRPTLGSVFSAIASLKLLDVGNMVHAQAIKQGLDRNVYVGSSLVNMYAKCHEPEFARRVFDSLDERNIVLWNVMLGCYAQNNFGKEVIELFISMASSGSKADEFTYTSILSACGYLERLDFGRQLHCVIIKRNLESNLFVGNALVDMYAKCKALAEARYLFEHIKCRDNVSWNAIIVGYVQMEEEDEGFRLFKRMLYDGIAPDEVAFSSIINACANMKDFLQGVGIHSLALRHGLERNLYVGSSLIDMYVKCGATSIGHKVFCGMSEHSVVSINTLISGYAQENFEEAVNLYKLMQVEGLSSSEITFASLLDGCNEPSKYDMGRQIHSIVLKKGHLYDDGFLGISLLGTYMSSLRKAEGMKLFSEFPQKKSPIFWTSMISGLNSNESYNEAMGMYREMRSYDVRPDQATFASILKACSALTFLKDGLEIHSFIIRTGFDSDVLVSSALIDLYAKCGNVKSSIQIFRDLDKRSDVIAWNSLISGLAKNGHVEDALKMFDDMMRSHVGPDDVTFLGVLSACSHSGKVSEGRRVYDIMVNEFGIRPRNDHCACMIDLYGRCGLLEEAEKFIESLDFEPDAMTWASFLGACKLHGDDVRGKKAAEKIIKLDPQSCSPYVLLSSMHALTGNWDEVDSLRKQMRQMGVTKFPGRSWVNATEYDKLVQYS